MDSNRNTVVDYSAMGTGPDGEKRGRTPGTRAYLGLAIVIGALVLAILLLAVLAQPVQGV